MAGALNVKSERAAEIHQATMRPARREGFALDECIEIVLAEFVFGLKSGPRGIETPRLREKCLIAIGGPESHNRLLLSCLDLREGLGNLLFPGINGLLPCIAVGFRCTSALPLAEFEGLEVRPKRRIRLKLLRMEFRMDRDSVVRVRIVHGKNCLTSWAL